ncbi:NDR1/HIN1-like protein 10 [Phragmites australis]|uniref:NDR1/HIN1-like protein 10 n=1 Tax=Phragmites australis TaxID=29695 RepID=UPI002D786936|nr:NDR1/HIN1-like protein 10 [Phragmites australis]
MCGCDDDCCYGVPENIKNCLIILGILTFLAAIVLVLVLVLAFGYLRHVAITVDDGSLTRFELVKAPGTAVAYNLSLTLTIRNPNWAIGIKNEKPLVAAYNFDGQLFDRVPVANKGDKMGARKTMVYHLASNSRNTGMLGNAGVAEFKKQKATGVFEVEVKLTGKFRYTARYTKCELDATCPLRLQLAPPGTPAVAFQKVKCTLAKPNKHC